MITVDDEVHIYPLSTEQLYCINTIVFSLFWQDNIRLLLSWSRGTNPTTSNRMWHGQPSNS